MENGLVMKSFAPPIGRELGFLIRPGGKQRMGIERVEVRSLSSRQLKPVFGHHHVAYDHVGQKLAGLSTAC
jgi:hypothetical protein